MDEDRYMAQTVSEMEGEVKVKVEVKPGEQLLADFDGLSLVHHGDDGDAHVLRRLK